MVLALDLDAFFRLDGLVDAIRIATPIHEAPGKLVDDDDLAVFDDVLLVFAEQLFGFERGLQLVRELEVGLIVQILDAEDLFDLGDAGFGDRHRVHLLVDCVVFALCAAAA